jgi:hypothetical protein
MARGVSRGSLYLCSFPENGMTPVSGNQLVVVLIPRYSPDTGQCLVAGAWMKDGQSGVNLHHVHTVRVDRLKECRLNLDENLIKAAQRNLSDKIKSAH